MVTLDDILTELQSREDCDFRSATRPPALPPDVRLPDDLAMFYSQFSEARLFGPDDPRCHISAPADFVNIGLAVCSERTTDPVQEYWYALAHVRDGNYFAIDLHPSRLGRCYDVFHECFLDMPDECAIIALSFTELLQRTAAAGDNAWWLAGFKGYGYGAELRSDSAADD